MTALVELNAMDKDAALAEFSRCCGAQRWAQSMVAHRPFSDNQSLFAAADHIWRQLDESDWLEAFDHHPQIGDLNSLRMKYAGNKDWSGGEQKGVDGASEAVLQGLHDGNKAYKDRFGYIFIVCATGKSAAEMLDLLTRRLDNPPAEEIKVAAGEQAKITRLRLEKLLS